MKNRDLTERIEPSAVLVVDINGRIFYASLEKNAASEEFVKKLSPAALKLDMTDNGDNEKTAALPWDLPLIGGAVKAKTGDILLYGQNRIAIRLADKETGAVRLASFGCRTEEISAALGQTGSVGLWLEWSE